FVGSSARPRLVEPQLQVSPGLKSAPVRPGLTPNQVVPPSMLLNTPRELSTAYIVLGLLGSNASPSIRGCDRTPDNPERQRGAAKLSSCPSGSRKSSSQFRCRQIAILQPPSGAACSRKVRLRRRENRRQQPPQVQ